MAKMRKKKQFFVVAQYVLRPRDPNLTSSKEYMADANNFQMDELFNIVTKIPASQLSTYGVIIDLTNRVLIKNTMNSSKSYDDVLSYFVNHYSERFTQMLGQYIEEIKDVADLNANNSAKLVPESELVT